MTGAVTVRVPASSANLGPGFDCLAAAIGLQLELEARVTGAFSLQTGLDVPRGRDNIAVRAFEQLRPADDVSFTMRSAIPLCGGLGSSAAARVAGLLAADRLLGGDGDVLAQAALLEGHPDNVAAALRGGFVVCGPGDPPAVATIAAPAGLAAALVVPQVAVGTRTARAALPAAVPHGDAAYNVAQAAQLVLGLERGDLELIARGLDDRLHQPPRASLYPQSMELVRAARTFGALGATISGAGPAVLVWLDAREAAAALRALREHVAGWAEVLDAPFEPSGAVVAASA